MVWRLPLLRLGLVVMTTAGQKSPVLLATSAGQQAPVHLCCPHQQAFKKGSGEEEESVHRCYPDPPPSRACQASHSYNCYNKPLRKLKFSNRFSRRQSGMKIHCAVKTMESRQL